jgi:hypothetical protein
MVTFGCHMVHVGAADREEARGLTNLVHLYIWGS